MKYSDLIEFEPIESVLKLHEADEKTTAQEHVDTFVMSPHLRQQLSGVVFPQLQFEAPKDNKGVLVVGNYGTGKTHLMSVISAICEHEDIVPDTEGDEDLEEAIESVQGKFKVARVTIGSSTKGLRDILCDSLEEHLSEMGVDYDFPPQNEIENHIAPFHEMMESFNEEYPEKGLLLVIDELLDYLRTRDEQQLMLDLSFLRELGEISSQVRFRAIAGLQESLFDNPSWAHVSENVKRVKDRYEQIRIAREDVENVVSKRLLQKTDEQKAKIRDHLDKFTHLYPTMTDRMDKFVDLFPVHPDFIKIFERIHVAERREVLKTLSRTMYDLLEDDVPENQPGLITFDTYWDVLSDDPSFLSNPDIKEVLDRAKTLEAKVEQSFPKEQYKPTALRIIYGLSVYRLTTPDIREEIGLTPADFRDQLFLYVSDMPEEDSEFLEGMIEVILGDILTTVNGQFISKNDENGQYFIDVDKDIDYDQNIEDQAKMLSPEQKDKAYFDAIRTIVLEDPELEPYVSGFRIWEHDIPWPDRNVDRPGYLFFGAPNERSTAQPPRDFYLYFLQPFKPPEYDDEGRSDEVFFDLVDPEADGFHEPLVTYASASKLQTTAQASHKRIYQEKAEKARKELVIWLRDNLSTECEVTWKGQTQLLKEWLPAGPHYEVRDMVEAVASTCVSSHFEDKYPKYPSFSERVTRKNREEYCRAAIKQILNTSESKHGTAILDGLGLLNSGELKPKESPYAQPVLKALESKGQGQVINRSELMESPSPDAKEVEKNTKIESELFMVVLAALCHHGTIVIALPSEKVDAANEQVLARKNISDLVRFKHLERPKDIPRAEIRALCRLLGVNEHLVGLPEQHNEMVEQIHEQRSDLIEEIVERDQWLQEPPTLWGLPQIPESLASEYRRDLNELKGFLESLQTYTTPAKLVNFKTTEDEIDEYLSHVELLTQLNKREKELGSLSELVKYLQNAELVIPEGHSWGSEVQRLKSELDDLLSQKNPSTAEIQSLEQEMGAAKTEYISTYLKLHKKSRLGPEEKQRRAALLDDSRVEKLQELSKISLVDASRLDSWTESVRQLKACHDLIPGELETDVKCPHCEFAPATETRTIPENVLDELEEELDQMESHWTETLVTDLQDPTVMEGIELLDEPEQRAIQRFLEQHELPEGEELETFVSGAMEVAKGLYPIRVSLEDVGDVLLASGSASKPAAVQRRFETFLNEQMNNRDPDDVRFVFVESSMEEEE